MTDQDWNTVVIKKKSNKKTEQIHVPENTLIQKTVLNEDNPIIKYVNKEFSQEIVKCRLEKKLKRSDLAKAINLPESILADYENGTAIHNGQTIAKIKRYLGINKK
jgi:ribosome-binding protein aMBF1 (putative translation factor)